MIWAIRQMGVTDDAATTLPEGETTRNLPLPKTKRGWGSQMDELTRRMHLMCLGGVGRGNLRQFQAGEENGEVGSGDDGEILFNVAIRTPARAGPPTPPNDSYASTPTRTSSRVGGRHLEGKREDKSQPSQPGVPNVHIPTQLERNRVWTPWRISRWLMKRSGY